MSSHPNPHIGLMLCCFMQLSTIFQLNRGCQLYLWRKLKYLEKTTDLPHTYLFGQGYCAQRHFQQHFSYTHKCIAMASFIGGGNRSTQGKPPTCHTSTHGTIIYDNKYRYRKYAMVVITRMLLFHDNHVISLFVQYSQTKSQMFSL